MSNERRKDISDEARQPRLVETSGFGPLGFPTSDVVFAQLPANNPAGFYPGEATDTFSLKDLSFLDSPHINIETPDGVMTITKSEKMREVEERFQRPIQDILHEQRFEKKIPSKEAAAMLEITRRTYSRWMTALVIDDRSQQEIAASIRHRHGRIVRIVPADTSLSPNERRRVASKEMWRERRDELLGKIQTEDAKRKRNGENAKKHKEFPGPKWFLHNRDE